MNNNDKKNIFEALREDHDKQRELFELLLSTSGDSVGRRRMFQDLKENLQAHAKYEERYFYAPLMDEDMTVEPSRHAVHEHYKIDTKLDELDSTDFSSPQWLMKLKELKDLVEHHLDEEEHEFFQMAGRVLSQSQKNNLASKYQNVMTD